MSGDAEEVGWEKSGNRKYGCVPRSRIALVCADWMEMKIVGCVNRERRFATTAMLVTSNETVENKLNSCWKNRKAMCARCSFTHQSIHSTLTSNARNAIALSSTNDSMKGSKTSNFKYLLSTRTRRRFCCSLFSARFDVYFIFCAQQFICFRMFP